MMFWPAFYLCIINISLIIGVPTSELLMQKAAANAGWNLVDVCLQNRHADDKLMMLKVYDYAKIYVTLYELYLKHETKVTIKEELQSYLRDQVVLLKDFIDHTANK